MMSKTLRGLLVSSACYLATASTGAAVAIVTHLPARFAGILRGDDVARDFLGVNGTALSPDLALVVAQAVFTGGALRRGRVGMVGVIGLTVLGAAYTLGQLGEPIAVEAFTSATRNLTHASLVAANIVCSSAMMLLGVLEWRRRVLSDRLADGPPVDPRGGARRGPARAGGPQ